MILKRCTYTQKEPTRKDMIVDFFYISIFHVFDHSNKANSPMTPVNIMPCLEIEAPGAAAPVNGLTVDEAEGVVRPVAPATPGTTVVLVARVVAAALGFEGTDVTPTRPTEVVEAETPVPVAVVNATCGTVYVLDE